MISSTGKKWRLFRAWAGRNPLWCAWQITYRCDFRCGFCHYWRDPAGTLPELTVPAIEQGAQKLASLGSLLVSIAGGEPLIRPDVPDIVRAVGRYHFPFLTTTGWDVTPALARELFAAGLWGVSISIDYADPARHDKSRGKRGAFERAVHALQHFAAARVHKWQRVNLMTVLLHDNLDQIERLIELAADCDAYFMIQPYGKRKTGSTRFVNPAGGVSARMLALKRKHRNVLSNRVFLSRFDQALNGGVPGCRAGEAFFSIDSVGDIAICVEERARPVANLLRDSPAQIVERLRARAATNTCTNCWYNCRGEVEMLYHPVGVVLSLPTLLFDHGRPADRYARGSAAARSS